MTALAVLRSPGVLRTLALAFVARLPLTAIGLLLLLQTRHLGHSYAVGGVATGAFTLGMAVGSPLMGRTVDRLGQPRVLHVTCLTAGIAIIALARVPPGLPGLLIALSAVIGFAQPPVAACVRVIWTRLLTGRDRDILFALDVSIQQVGYMIGPTLLLWVAGTAGPPVALEVTGLMLILSSSAFALGPEVRSASAVSQAFACTALRPISQPGVRTLVAVTMALGICFGAVELGIVAAAEREHNRVPLALLYGAWALGGLAAGLLWARRSRSGDRVREISVLLLATATATMLLAIPLDPWWLVPRVILVGIVTTPLFTLLYATMADVAPPDALGEAYSWEVTGGTGGIALGTAAGGSVVGLLGLAGLFIMAALAVLAGSAILVGRSETVTDHTLQVPQVRLQPIPENPS